MKNLIIWNLETSLNRNKNMNTKYIRFLKNWAFVLLIPLMAGCSIDPEPSINQLLTGRNSEGKAWQLKTILVNGKASEYPCEEDDLYIFKTQSGIRYRGGTLIIKPQFLKCYLGETEQELDWFYGGTNDRYVYVEVFEEGVLQIVQYEIIKITATTLELEHVYEFPYGDKIEITHMEFKHQP